MTNCPNCAAPLKGGKCEYCGTQVDPPRRVIVPENCGSFLEITADRIQIGAIVGKDAGKYRKIVINQN